MRLSTLLPATLAGLLLAGTLAGSAAAQAAPTLSHLALYVADLRKSAAFYKDVLQLPEIPEPFKDGRHVWLRIGPHSQLHLIQGAAGVASHDKNTHLAFSVKDLKKFAAHLDQAHVRYGSWAGDARQTTPRPDGVQQVYFQDPDNFWIEVNDDTF